MGEKVGEKAKMGIQCLVIPADSSQDCYLTSVSSLRQMQNLVGGYIEAVRVDTGRWEDPTLLPSGGVRNGHEATLYVNEEFRLSPGVPRNERASRFYPWSGGILGDAFLCGPVDSEGNDTDVSVGVAAKLLSPF